MTGFRQPSFASPGSEPPQQIGADGTRSWIVRGANFGIVYSEGNAGAEIAAETRDEYFVYIVQGAVSVRAGDDVIRLSGESLAIVPPGSSSVTLEANGAVVRLFTNREADVMAAAGNAATYAGGAPEAAPAEDWPEPVGGYRLRGYALAPLYESTPPPYVFRTRRLMAAPYPAHSVPRDETSLSPHSHADFEQGSVALDGVWVHHLRVPWTANRQDWRDDVHERLDSPSIAVVPAGIIHTSQSVSGERMRLLDVFGPPRRDFSLMPGAVRNADVYPMPAGKDAAA